MIDEHSEDQSVGDSKPNPEPVAGSTRPEQQNEGSPAFPPDSGRLWANLTRQPTTDVQQAQAAAEDDTDTPAPFSTKITLKGFSFRTQGRRIQQNM